MHRGSIANGGWDASAALLRAAKSTRCPLQPPPLGHGLLLFAVQDVGERQLSVSDERECDLFDAAGCGCCYGELAAGNAGCICVAVYHCGLYGSCDWTDYAGASMVPLVSETASLVYLKGCWSSFS